MDDQTWAEVASPLVHPDRPEVHRPIYGLTGG